jgi:hypothetical protein
MINKYTNKLWRPSVAYSGQFAARSIRKGIEKAMSAGQQVLEVTSMADHNAVIAQAKDVKRALVLLVSSKQRISPLTASLAMSVQGRALVAQVMPGAETADVLAKYSVEKAPALVVLPANTGMPFWLDCMYVCMYICMYVCMYVFVFEGGAEIVRGEGVSRARFRRFCVCV